MWICRICVFFFFLNSRCVLFVFSSQKTQHTTHLSLCFSYNTNLLCVLCKMCMIQLLAFHFCNCYNWVSSLFSEITYIYYTTTRALVTIGDLKGIYIVKTRFFSTPDSEHILRITMNSNHSGSSRRSFSRGHRQRMYSHNSHNNLHSHNDNYQHRNYGQWYKEPDPCYSHRYTLVSFIMCTSSFFFFIAHIILF